MARNAARLTDVNSGGGAINNIPQTNVFANSLLVSVNGAVGTSHPPCPTPVIHCGGVWRTANGSPNVFINNIPVNRLSDADTCGHVRVGGSPNVFIN